MESTAYLSTEIEEWLCKSADLKRKIVLNHTPQIVKIVRILIRTLDRGGKILLFGNGGSASDAQHIAGDLMGSHLDEEVFLPAISLGCNSTVLTSVGNDSSFEDIFSCQIQALGRKEDTVIALSTSGNSVNVIKGVKKAKDLKLTTIGFLGKDGGELKTLVDFSLVVPSQNTPRIQEVHISILHIVSHLVREHYIEWYPEKE